MAPDRRMAQVQLDLAAAKAAQIAEAFRRGQTWPGDVAIASAEVCAAMNAAVKAAGDAAR